MKKIMFFCAALFAAVSVFADEPRTMTCAEAKAEALDNLQAGETGTELVAITGYVTYTEGTISRGQQTFWMDDVKGTEKTFQAYWCNMPGGNDDKPLEAGDHVTITGYLMNYGGTTAEMKNGDVTILERVELKRDTIPAKVCEAIEEGEALEKGDLTHDLFEVEGVVLSIDKTDEANKQQTFWMQCDDNEKKFEAYYVTMLNDEFAETGDTVHVLGRIKNFNGTIEIANGKAWVTGKGEAYIPQVFEMTVAEAVEEGMKLDAGIATRDIYVVTGFVTEIAYAYSEEKGNMSFYMSDDMENPTQDFQAYRCNVANDMPVGTLVKVTGHLKKYVSTKDEVETITIEIAEGTGEEVSPSGIHETIINLNATKVMHNGQLMIRRNNNLYNAIGTQVK